MSSRELRLISDLSVMMDALQTVKLLIGLTRNFYGTHRDKQAMLQLIELFIIHTLDGEDTVDLTIAGRELLELLDNDDDDESPSPTGDLEPLH